MRMFSPDLVEESTYIREMESKADWQGALENRSRPVLIQVGATWCPPCKVLKPKLLDAVKGHNGAVELLYMDIDKF